MPWLRSRARRRLGTGGAVAVITALGLLPLSMMVGLAVDYSFYVSAGAQLNLAADSAAMHAVRVASSAASGSTTSAQTAAGKVAAQQWFAAQLGNLTSARVSSSNVSAVVTYSASPSTYTATVSYSGTVATHFSALFGLSSWPISGTATSVVTDEYVEVLMLLDNSPSMLLGSSNSDILALEQATVCPQWSAGQDTGAYPWSYPAPSYGFGPGYTVPPSSQIGTCNTAYDGNPALCKYMMSYPNISQTTGKCTNGGGGGGASGSGGWNWPQSPCGFACHSDANYNDYFGIARQIGVTLRLDVVQQAAVNVVSTMISAEETAGQFSVGVYEFSNALQQVYPTSGEASTNLSAALSAVQTIRNSPPLTTDAPDTDFPTSANALASQVTAGGTGLTSSTPQKNLFIVTDGMNDTSVFGNQVLAPMTSSTNETICQQFKNKGFAVYVLYIPYLPVPNVTYLQKGMPVAEPTNTSPNIQALQACASASKYFYTASSATAITQAMASMIQTALSSAARISR